MVYTVSKIGYQANILQAMRIPIIQNSIYKLVSWLSKMFEYCKNLSFMSWSIHYGRHIIILFSVLIKTFFSYLKTAIGTITHEVRLTKMASLEIFTDISSDSKMRRNIQNSTLLRSVKISITLLYFHAQIQKVLPGDVLTRFF